MPRANICLLTSLALLPAAAGLIAPFPGTRPKSSSPTTRSRVEIAPETISIAPHTDRAQVGTLDVPHLGIGTISWGGDGWDGSRSDDVEALASLAARSGLNFFDTAERYGGSLSTALGLGWGETERLCRRYLVDSPPPAAVRPAIVASKFTPSPWRTTAESVVEACIASAENLGGTDGAVDLYQIHMPDIVQPLARLGMAENVKDEIFWEGLAQCYLRGHAKNVGVSNYGPTLLRRCHAYLAARGVPLASNQINYSLLHRSAACGAQATVDAGRALGVTTLAYFPLAMGLLTGKFDGADDSDSSKTSLERKELRGYAHGGAGGIPAGGAAPLTAALRSIAHARGKSCAQVALNWVMCQGAVPIPGARTARQVADNAGALGWRLSAEEQARLERAADDLGFEFDGAGFKRSSSKFVGYGVETWRLD